jgi:hypothetical protein
MNIKKIAENINLQAKNYEMGKFQEIRKEIKGLNKSHTLKIFSSMTIYEDYAFHDGGRTEIQYNIGLEKDENENELLRYGLAFSLEPGKTLPDVSILFPKIRKLNYLIKGQPDLFAGYKMWSYNQDGRSETLPVHEIPSSLIQQKVFIFFGKLMPFSKIDYTEILTTFDEMLPIYADITTDNNTRDMLEKSSGKNQFKFIKTNVSLPASRNYTSRQISIDIDIRHSKIQEILMDKLIDEFGNENVSLEHPIFGNKIDIVVKDKGKIYFYEIKTALTARECVSQAMGQILDYSFWPGQKNADKLFIVGEEKIDMKTQSYLHYLNNVHDVPLEYIRITL